MFRFAVRMLVNITTLMWHFGSLKALDHSPWEMLPCSHELFPALHAFPGFTWMGYARICHSYHSNNQGLTHLLCHILKSLHMTHHSAGKQEVLHLGEEVKRTPRLRTTLFSLSSVLFSSTRQHPNRVCFITPTERKIRAVGLHQCLTSETSCDQELQPRGCSTDPLPADFWSCQSTKPLASKHRDQSLLQLTLA